MADTTPGLREQLREAKAAAAEFGAMLFLSEQARWNAASAALDARAACRAAVRVLFPASGRLPDGTTLAEAVQALKDQQVTLAAGLPWARRRAFRRGLLLGLALGALGAFLITREVLR